ncbi:CAP domain-containing protein [Streptodolium elevatio]|uniref:SCP domain-containing protein n=1 Tax=Streptodolium elevatio TaxID=3157996 RepID=A0ABV3DPW3_9ACTN
MKRRRCVAVVAAAVAAVSLLGSAPALASTAEVAARPTAAQVVPADVRQAREYYPDVDYITCEINKERTVQGLSPLLVSDRASEVGRGHARDMAGMKRLTSVGSDGRGLRDRLNDAGIYSNLVQEFMFSGYNHDGHFADMATDPTPENGFYKALMSRDVVAWGVGYDRLYWDVNLLGYHRKLGARPAVCSRTAG